MGVLTTRKALLLVGGLAAGLLLGCQNDEIKRYQAPKDETRSEAASKGPALEGMPTYRAPEAWKETRPNTARNEWKAFQVVDGDSSATATVSLFPGDGGGLLMNVNRWLAQIGLDPLTEEQLPKELGTINVAGKPAPLLDRTGPGRPGKGRERLLGVIATRGERTWFFKLIGPPELVEKQKPAFEAFVKSVQFGGTGANDG
jgi:hypothetical protein